MVLSTSVSAIECFCANRWQDTLALSNLSKVFVLRGGGEPQINITLTQRGDGKGILEH